MSSQQWLGAGIQQQPRDVLMGCCPGQGVPGLPGEGVPGQAGARAVVQGRATKLICTQDTE